MSSSDIVISVEGLSKRYLVGHQSARTERYTALRDVVGRHVKNFARKSRDILRGRQIVQGDEVEDFWALRDVSFEVKRGEVLPFHALRALTPGIPFAIGYSLFTIHYHTSAPLSPFLLKPRTS